MMLMNYGDFLNRAHKLVPCGYNEEWWQLETKSKNKDVSIDEAIDGCKKNNWPLHPKYTFFWNALKKEQFVSLIEWLKEGVLENDELVLLLRFDIDSDVSDKDPKRALELLGVPHTIQDLKNLGQNGQIEAKKVVIEKEWSKALRFSLNELDQILDFEGSVLDYVNKLSGVIIRDKLGTFIGARMGRPEKSKMRKIIGSPNVLFPVGSVCERCDSVTIQRYFCKTCKIVVDKPICHDACLSYSKREIDVDHYFRILLKKYGIRNCPDIVKGVRGTINVEHIPENLMKGVMRAIYGLNVNKDGTVRYDMTEMPLTHFRGFEINTDVQRLKELGYDKDIYGEELIKDDQLLELKPQDVVLPACPDTLDNKADDVMFKIAKFVDDLLVKLYGVEPFYNLKSSKELVGHLVVCMSPHTSAGVMARIIGFSKTQAFLAHPYLHSLMRRDCFSYDTIISVMKNGAWKNVKIGELVEELKLDRQVDLFGTLAKKVNGYYTIGLKDGKPDIVKINDFTKHKPSKILKIKTNDGRELRVTQNHKFLVNVDGMFKEISANELANQMKLVVPIKYNVEPRDIDFIDLIYYYSNNDSIMIRNIKDFMREVICKLGGLSIIRKTFDLSKSTLDNFISRDSFPLPLFLLLTSKARFNIVPRNSYLGAKRDHVNLPNRIQLNNDVLNIIGLYVAEGFARKKTGIKGLYQVDFSATEQEIRDRIIKVMKKYFLLNPSYTDKDHITYSSRILYEFFVDILKCGKNAYEKRIPEIIMNLPLEKIKYFLQGYFDGDGSVSKSDSRVCCDSVSDQLLQDLEFVLRRYGIYTMRYWYKKKPGPKVSEFYIRKNREIPEFEITKLVITSSFYKKFYEQIGFSLTRKHEILEWLIKNTNPYGMEIEFDENYVYPEIKEIVEDGFETTYCLNVENHVVNANGLFVKNCDGDESCIILLMDLLLNFSKKFIPGSRGAKHDEPLILTSVIIPSEVDDMVFDMDIAFNYPLELYQGALEYKMPKEIKVERVGNFLGTEKQYEGFGFTHDTSDINSGVLCSSYKFIPSMQEKVQRQMRICDTIRAVDEVDVARLIIERHFLRDIKGNLRKFSMQQFRCVACNEKFRRVPLQGKCTKCKGKILFTISEGSIIKYLQPSMSLAEKYNLPAYLQQSLELLGIMIESLFGKDKEKQEDLGKWFKPIES